MVKKNIYSLDKKQKLYENLKEKDIGAYKQVANKILSGNVKDKEIIYTAQTPQGYNYKGYQKNTMRAYAYDKKNNDVYVVFENTKVHRAKIALSNYDKYLKGEISPEIWENYVTNGYNTRRGLFKSQKNIKRIKEINLSHANYIGKETGNSTIDHINRVSMRNN